MADSMYSILVAINVKAEHREPFIDVSLVEARGVIEAEVGVFQFQMLQDEKNPNRFYFFEIFKDEDAAKKHWDTDIFKTWWNTV